MHWCGTDSDALDVINWVTSNGGVATYRMHIDANGDETNERITIDSLTGTQEMRPGDSVTWVDDYFLVTR